MSGVGWGGILSAPEACTSALKCSSRILPANPCHRKNIIGTAKSQPNHGCNLTDDHSRQDCHGLVLCDALPVSRDEALEADLKSLLYYFRHHTVEPEILNRLCFVEIVYSLQNHANRCGFGLNTQASPASAVIMTACPPKAFTRHYVMDHREQKTPSPTCPPPPHPQPMNFTAFVVAFILHDTHARML